MPCPLVTPPISLNPAPHVGTAVAISHHVCEWGARVLHAICLSVLHSPSQGLSIIPGACDACPSPAYSQHCVCECFHACYHCPDAYAHMCCQHGTHFSPASRASPRDGGLSLLVDGPSLPRLSLTHCLSITRKHAPTRCLPPSCSLGILLPLGRNGGRGRGRGVCWDRSQGTDLPSCYKPPLL